MFIAVHVVFGKKELLEIRYGFQFFGVISQNVLYMYRISC